jgi:hypothetical protein
MRKNTPHIDKFLVTMALLYEGTAVLTCPVLPMISCSFLASNNRVAARDGKQQMIRNNLKLHLFDLLWICFTTSCGTCRKLWICCTTCCRAYGSNSTRSICFEFVVDFLRICCTICCTTNPQQIEQVEFER